MWPSDENPVKRKLWEKILNWKFTRLWFNNHSWRQYPFFLLFTRFTQLTRFLNFKTSILLLVSDCTVVLIHSKIVKFIWNKFPLCSRFPFGMSPDKGTILFFFLLLLKVSRQCSRFSHPVCFSLERPQWRSPHLQNVTHTTNTHLSVPWRSLY